MQVETEDDYKIIKVSDAERRALREADEVLYRFMCMATDENSNPDERKQIDEARKAMAQLGNY